MVTVVTIILTALVAGVTELARRRGETPVARWVPGLAALTVLVGWMLVAQPDMTPASWAVWSVVLLGTGVAVGRFAAPRTLGA